MPAAPADSEGDSTLFCYAFARTPHEHVLPLFMKQLALACDGWVVFSWRNDGRLGVVKAYTHKQERSSVRSHQEWMMRGGWQYMNSTGILRQYDWFLKVEPDTFLVPSRLRKAIFKYPKGFKKLITQGVEADGFFTVISQDLFLETIEGYVRHPDCFHRDSFDEWSGVFLQLPHCPRMEEVEGLVDSDGDAIVASFAACKELRDVKHRSAYVASPKQRLCTRFDNTLLSCFEYGSSRDCSKERVLKGHCGRRLPAGKCVSSHFVALHPVKKHSEFLSLMSDFP